MRKKTKNTIIISSIIGIVLLLVVIGLVNKNNTSQLSPLAISGDTGTVRPLVPHFASFKCDVIDTGTPSYTLPETGFWISGSDSGIFTDRVTSIKVDVSKTFWDLAKQWIGGGSRLRYQVCNAQKANCAEYTDTVTFFGAYSLQHLPSSLDLRTQSAFIILEGKSNIFASWKGVSSEGSKISFTYDKFGLKLVSTIQDPAGKIVCSTSCDFTCPDQAYRSKLVYTTQSTLPFYQTAPYIEFWDEPAAVGQDFGGSYWLPDREEFCFGGYIYNAGNLKTQDGKTYTYPEQYTRKEACCPGAVSQTVNGPQQCTNNFKWEFSGSGISCTSDLQCPGQGQPTCQRTGNQYQESGWSCVKKQCVQDQTKPVQCCAPAFGCPSDQVCQAGACVSGGTVPPITSCAVDTDCNAKTGGKCVNAICQYPDPKDQECPPIWGFIPDVFCQIQKSAEKVWLIIKFISIALLTLMTLSFANSQVGRLRILRNNRLLIFLVSLGISIAVAYLLYVFIGSILFWFILVGLIALIVVMAIYFPEGFVIINNFRRKR